MSVGKEDHCFRISEALLNLTTTALNGLTEESENISPEALIFFPKIDS